MLTLAGKYHYECKSNVILDSTLFISVTSKNNTVLAILLENCLDTADS